MACEGFLDFYDETQIVKDNVFKSMPQDRTKPPALADVRALLPSPYWAGHDAHINAYWKAWEIAFTNLERPHRGNGFKSPYLATAFNDALFLWDSVFGLMMGKLGAAAFNFQATLNNLYSKQHPDGFISREIREWSGKDQFHRYDPASTGPNVLGFSEWESYLITGDKDRLAKVFPVILAYHRWCKLNRTWPDGSYHSCGLACGMDNQPRVEGYNAWLSHGWQAWVDATAQALLSAKTLIAMAKELGHAEKKPGSTLDARDGLSLPRPATLQATSSSKYAGEINALIEECAHLERYLNEKMWDKSKKFYVDRRLKEGTSTPYSSVKTVGAYWTLLAGAATPERAKLMIQELDNPRTFNRPVRVPSLAATDPHYRADGAYWLGSSWSPTTFLTLRALTAQGTVEADDVAADIGRNYNEAIARLYRTTNTLWENVAPEHSLLTEQHKEALRNSSSATTRAWANSAAGKAALSSTAKGPVPGSPAKPDFVGWGGVPATTILLEYVFGFRPQASDRSLMMDIRLLDSFGVKQFPFYGGLFLDLQVASRGSFDEAPKVTVTVRTSPGAPAASAGAGAGSAGPVSPASSSGSTAQAEIKVKIRWGRQMTAEGGWSPERSSYKLFEQIFTVRVAGAEGAAQELVCVEGGGGRAMEWVSAEAGAGTGAGAGAGTA
jgi:Trehalase